MNDPRDPRLMENSARWLQERAERTRKDAVSLHRRGRHDQAKAKEAEAMADEDKADKTFIEAHRLRKSRLDVVKPDIGEEYEQLSLGLAA